MITRFPRSAFTSAWTAAPHGNATVYHGLLAGQPVQVTGHAHGTAEGQQVYSFTGPDFETSFLADSPEEAFIHAELAAETLLTARPNLPLSVPVPWPAYAAGNIA